MRDYVVRYSLCGTRYNITVSAYNHKGAEDQVRAMFGSGRDFKIITSYLA